MRSRTCIAGMTLSRPDMVFIVITIAAWMLAGSVVAQTASIPAAYGYHNLYNDQTPPGVIGRGRSDLRGPVQCQYQPVKISAEADARIALAQGNMFQQSSDKPFYAGLILGNVYRIQVTEIPHQPGWDIYPTVELIDRVYPPVGQEVRFAIPIVISQDDMQQALGGNLVTRVIYLEDPQTALPIADSPGQQRDFDIMPNQDALDVADSLGRPVAIIRYGSRTPPRDVSLMNAFLMGCPPWLPLPSPHTRAMIPAGQTATIRTPHIPRDDIPVQTIPAYAQPPASTLTGAPGQASRPRFMPASSGVMR